MSELQVFIGFVFVCQLATLTLTWFLLKWTREAIEDFGRLIDKALGEGKPAPGEADGT